MSGPVAMIVHVVPFSFWSRGNFFADHADVGFGSDGLGDAAGELDAIDGEGVACRHGCCICKGQKHGVRAAHFLLQEPGRGIGRFALEGVGADELTEIDGLVGGGEARLAVDHGAHFVEIDLAAEARSGQRGFRTGEASANDTYLHLAASTPASLSRASPVTRTLRQASRNSAPMAA